jgi:hypothetical protein
MVIGRRGLTVRRLRDEGGAMQGLKAINKIGSLEIHR